MTGDDNESYCCSACRQTALNFARSLPYRRAIIPQTSNNPTPVDEDPTKPKKKIIRPKKREPLKSRKGIPIVANSLETVQVIDTISEETPKSPKSPYEFVPATQPSMVDNEAAIDAAASAIAGLLHVPRNTSPGPKSSEKLSSLMAEIKQNETLSMKQDEEKLSEKKNQKKPSLFKSSKSKSLSKSANGMTDKSPSVSPVSLSVSERSNVGGPKPMGKKIKENLGGTVEGYAPKFTSSPPLRSLFSTSENAEEDNPLWPWGAPMKEAEQPKMIDGASICQPCTTEKTTIPTASFPPPPSSPPPPPLVPVEEEGEVKSFEADLEFKVLSPAQIAELTAEGQSLEAMVQAKLEEKGEVKIDQSEHKEQDNKFEGMTPNVGLREDEDDEFYDEDYGDDAEDDSYYDDDEEDEEDDCFIPSPYLRALDLLESFRTCDVDAFCEMLEKERRQKGSQEETFFPAPLSKGNTTNTTSKHVGEVDRQESLLKLLKRDNKWFQSALFKESKTEEGVQRAAMESSFKNATYLLKLCSFVAPFPFPINAPTQEVISQDDTDRLSDANQFWKLIILVIVTVSWPPEQQGLFYSKEVSSKKFGFKYFYLKDLGVDCDEFNALCNIFIEDLL